MLHGYIVCKTEFNLDNTREKPFLNQAEKVKQQLKTLSLMHFGHVSVHTIREMIIIMGQLISLQEDSLLQYSEIGLCLHYNLVSGINVPFSSNTK